MNTGRFIVFEGIDGTGKSTQIELLAKALEASGHQVVCTREPTDGAYGRQIRALYTDRHQVSKEQECRLFIEDRREHVDQCVLPALKAGKVVLCDRYYFSTAAYQGAAGLDPQSILAQNQTFAPEPNLVLFIVLDVEEAIHRIRHYRQETLNQFEQKEYLEKVKAIFETMRFPFIQRVDGTRSIEAIHAEVLELVREVL